MQMKPILEKFESSALPEPTEEETAPWPLTRSGGAEEHRAQARSDYVTRSVAKFLEAETGLSESGARQLAEYFIATYKALGVIPSQHKLVIERFFDESGGMQLVIHAPF